MQICLTAAATAVLEGEYVRIIDALGGITAHRLAEIVALRSPTTLVCGPLGVRVEVRESSAFRLADVHVCEC